MSELKAKDIVEKLRLDYIDLERVVVMRSVGTSTNRTLARIHSISKIIQQAVGVQSHYVIEFLSENFDRLSQEDKTRTLIHELMHIPTTFGGGFRQHGTHVTSRSVEKMYRKYVNLCS